MTDQLQRDGAVPDGVGRDGVGEDDAPVALPSPSAITAALDGRWHQVRERARAFVGSAHEVPAHDLSTSEHRSRVTAQLREWAAAGIPQVGFPAESGGGGDIGGGMVAIEMLGYRDLSLMVKAGVQWGLFAGAIHALGTERHTEVLTRAVHLDTLGCFAMTETGHGSDVQSLLTTATYDPDTETFVVHSPSPAARKDYIGNAAVDGRLAVVFAQLISGGEEHGVHALLVPIRDADGAALPGVTLGDCGRKAGLNGVDNGRILFDSVRVPRENLLDKFGQVAADGTYSSPIESRNRRFFTMLGTLVKGRISVGGAALNAAKHAQLIATRYALTRRQFPRSGAPADEVLLLDYRSHQRRLLPQIADSYALTFAHSALVSSLDDLWSAGGLDEHAQRELESRAAGLKAACTRHATDTIQACREACGGAGYLAENTLPQLKSDTDVFTTFEGDNTVLLQLVGKGLLTSYAAAFEDLDTAGTVRFVAESFAGAVLERTVSRSVLERVRRASEDDLHSRAWQLHLLEDREQHLVETLAARMRRRGSDGAKRDPFQTLNEAQPHLLEAARAHIDRIVLEAFIAGIESCENAETRAFLERVCDLHALAGIERNRGWYLEHNRISDRRSKAVTAAVDTLCADLRADAALLVDGFGIPEQWVDAVIAQPQP